MEIKYKSENLLNRIIELKNSGAELQEIAKNLKTSQITIKKCLRYFGYSDKWLKHQFDYDYFNILNTEEKAYWAGFILADGSIYKNTLSIELSIKDINHLYKLNKSLKSTYIIDDNSKPERELKVCRLKITSENMKFQDGFMFPNKTNRLKIPSMSENLIRHFYRGFFDGDGWISYRIRHNSQISKNYPRLDVGLACYSESFMLNYRDHMEKIAGHKASLCIRKPNEKTKRRGITYQVVFSNMRAAKTVLDYMYKDSTIYLDRKYEKYKGLV